MIKIKLAELFRHRNETTFRPYLMAKNLFEDIGVQFVTEGPCDLTWVGQASYNDKKNVYTYGNCLSRGLHYLNSEVTGEYVLFDGQDSASLLGSFDVLKNSEAKLLIKNSLYKSFEDYLTPWKMGRMYWGVGEPLLSPNDNPEQAFGYALNEHDKDTFNKVLLSGCNWLSTVNPRWYDYKKIHKDIDVFALFSFPAKENFEFGCKTNIEYDAHRRNCVKELEKLKHETGLKVMTLENGVHVPIEEYYNLMSRSKIVIAPFGYGEMAPRDIEAAQFGAILIKPDMNHINTLPNPYNSEKQFGITSEIYEGDVDSTYAACAWNFSDLNELVLLCLYDFENRSTAYVENMRRTYINEYNPENLVRATYEWLTKLEGFETE